MQRDLELKVVKRNCRNRRKNIFKLLGKEDDDDDDFAIIFF